jgi:nucleotide-binding universal stress UspA family protein
MRTILLHIRDDEGQESRLRAALDLTRWFEGHLVCLQATPFDSYIIGDPFGGVYAFPEVVERVRETEEALRSRLEADLANEGVSWEWLHFDGSAAQMMVERSRLADVIVVSKPVREKGASKPLPIAAEIALHSVAPVLAVPGSAQGLDCGGIAVIAWNGSAEAAQALRHALPLLRAASSVHLLTVDADRGEFPSTEASRYLDRQGVDAELHEVPTGPDGVARTIAAFAAEQGSAYIVMGAYGHSRLRELILGGVTNEMLQAETAPLLLSH